MRFARRNSTLSIVAYNGHLCVKKQYHSRFTAVQENEAFSRVGKLTQGQHRIRCANVYGIEPEFNAIYIEYIPGLNLADDFVIRGVEALSKPKTTLLSLFQRASDANVRFDSDPKNLIRGPKRKELVIVDPTCEDIDLQDFCIVVFLWGLIKLLFQCQGPVSVVRLVRCWRSYYREYMKLAGRKPRELTEQLSYYIEAVIRWNWLESDHCSFAERLMRKALVVPLCYAFKLAFSWNVVMAKAS